MCVCGLSVRQATAKQLKYDQPSRQGPQRQTEEKILLQTYSYIASCEQNWTYIDI